MTLTAAALYPWVINISSRTERIYLASDSRITDSNTGKSKDIANKVHQVAGNMMVGYAGNVMLAERSIEKFKEKLKNKREWRDTKQIVGFFKSVIQNFKRHSPQFKEADADFLLALIDETNYPVLYVYRYKLGYDPVLVDPKITPVIVIGEDFKEQSALKDSIGKCIEEIKPIDEPGKYAIAMKKGFQDYIKSARTKTVHDPIQIFSLAATHFGGEITMVNHVMISSDGELLEKTIHNDEVWVKEELGVEVKRTSRDILKDFYDSK